MILLPVGLRPPFTEAPSSVLYAETGSTVTLVWNYDHGSVKRISIEYLKSGTYVVLVVKESDGTVKTNPKEPASLTSRVTIKDNATFVIRSFTNSDSTKYRCGLKPTVGAEKLTDPVEIVVVGRYSTRALTSYPYGWRLGGDLYIEIITINDKRNETGLPGC